MSRTAVEAVVNSEGGGQSHLTAAPNPRKDNFIMPENNDSAAIEAVQPGSARWKQLVREAIRLDATVTRALTARNWFLGDAALEIVPMGESSVHTGAWAALARFADEIGIEFNALRNCRAVARAWPPPTRVGGVAWSVHQVLAAENHRHLIEPGMNHPQARAALDARHRAADACCRTVDSAPAPVPQAEPSALAALAVSGELVLAMGDIRAKAKEIIRVLQEQGEQLDDRTRESIARFVADTRLHLDAIASLAEHGGVTDEAIARLIDGGNTP
jgi:hypothetical protein